MKNLILIANYNQHKEIGKFLDKVAQVVPKDNVVVVDDGSTDGSDAIAVEKGYKVIRHQNNLGIGAGIRTGLKYGIINGFEGVLISSSNGKMNPAEFPLLLKILDEGKYPYVQGSRFTKDGASEDLPLFRKIMIPLLSLVFTLIFGKRMTDITCGLRAYKLELLKHPSMNLEQEWLNKYEMEYYLHIKFIRNMKVPFVEVPVTISYSQLEKGRKSKIKPFIGWWSMARPFVFLLLGIKR